MFKLQQITKDYNEAGALCTQINLFGFVDHQIFLTKTGDLGIVLKLDGVDYECLDSNTIGNLTKRLNSAFRIFDEKCRVYQYLFKRNHENIPFKSYENTVVNAAIQSRIAYLKTKADSLYSFQIYYIVLYEGFRYETSILNAVTKIPSQPRQALDELLSFLSTQKQVVLLENEIERASVALRLKAEAFLLQVRDFVTSDILTKREAFVVLKQVLNFSPLKIENTRLKHNTFLDYYLCESHLECHRGFLRSDNYYLKVLTLKEPSAQTFPLIFKRLLESKRTISFVPSGRSRTRRRVGVSFTRADAIFITPSALSPAMSRVQTSHSAATMFWWTNPKKHKFTTLGKPSRNSKSRETTLEHSR